MNSVLVTAIVRAKDHEDFIEEALRSLFDQTHDRLELILADEGSADGTLRLARVLTSGRFARRFDRVCILGMPSGSGPVDALNAALLEAKGRYVILQSGDDVSRADRVAQMLSALLDSGSRIAFSSVDPFYYGSGPLPDEVSLLHLSQRSAAARDVTIGFALLRGNIPVSSGNAIFARELLDEVGLVSPLTCLATWDFTLQAVTVTEPLFVDEPLYRYRLHDKNVRRYYSRPMEVETEIVYRRFFRRILQHEPKNGSCPCPQYWPGYFEAFVRALGRWPSWAKEAGISLPIWRTVERIGWANANAVAATDTVEDAVRFLVDRLVSEVSSAGSPPTGSGEAS